MYLQAKAGGIHTKKVLCGNAGANSSSSITLDAKGEAARRGCGLSKEEHREDALALRAEERRDKLRKAVGSRKWAVIHGSLNGETRLRSPQSPCHEKEATPHSGMEGTR